MAITFHPDGTVTGGKIKSSGSVIQVVEVVKTDPFSVTGTSYVDITGLSQTISYTAGHKILIMFNGNIGMDEAAQMGNIVLANSSGVIAGSIGAANGSRQQATTSSRHYDTSSISPVCFTYLDTPSGTSETYKVKIGSANAGRTTYLNRSGSDENAGYRTRTASTLTLMEIAV